jgi:hypothetical protein
MISKLALAALAAVVSAEDIDAIYPHQLYRRDGGSHSHSSSSSGGSAYGAPEPSYSAPAPSYGAPEPSYSAPAPSYGAPEPSYGAPEPSYGAPEPSYSSPSYGYEEASGGLDLTSILIPILALLGLSLLFPTFVTVNGTRKKRDVMDEDEGPDSNLVERVQSIYMAVLESEECVERVVCELGGLAEDAGFSKKMTKSLEMFAPKKYAKMMKTFNHGKDCKKNNKCGYF